MPEIPPQGKENSKMPVTPPQGNGKMPVTPPQGNKFVAMIKKLVNNYKSHSFRYTIFIILLNEFISLFIAHSSDYAIYWYPLLNNITLFALLFNESINANKYKLCIRKKLAYSFLSAYFAFNILYQVLKINDDTFYNIVFFGLLLPIVIIIAIGIYKKQC